MIAQVGEVLNADVAALYVKDKQGDLDCQDIWSKNQSMSAEEYVTEWQRAKHEVADHGRMVRARASWWTRDTL